MEVTFGYPAYEKIENLDKTLNDLKSFIVNIIEYNNFNPKYVQVFPEYNENTKQVTFKINFNI